MIVGDVAPEVTTGPSASPSLDVDAAVNQCRLTLEAKSTVDRHIAAKELADSLWTRYQQNGASEDLDECILWEAEVLKLIPLNHPDCYHSVSSLAFSLRKRYRECGDMRDMDESIRLERAALELCPVGHQDRRPTLNQLVICLEERFQRNGDPQDLDDIICMQRGSVQLSSQEEIAWAELILDLAASLETRFHLAGALQDLDDSICTQRALADILPKDDVMWIEACFKFTTSLWKRFKLNGDSSDLDDCIMFERQLLESCPSEHPDRRTFLSNSAASLRSRFQRATDSSDLDEAIRMDRCALQLSTSDCPDLQSIANLATDLSTRFEHSGDRESLDESIDLGHLTLSIRDKNDPKRPTSLGAVGCNLRSRFKNTSDASDIDMSIRLHHEAIELCPIDDAERPVLLGSCASSHRARFNYSGDIEDLETCVRLGRGALELRPPGHSDRHRSLNDLALDLQQRFTYSGDLDDIEESVRLNRAALTLRPPGHALRGASLTNLAISLRARYEFYGHDDNLHHVEEFISLDRAALELCPTGHRDRHHTLCSLSSSLSLRIKRSWSAEDLDEIIDLCRAALELRPVGHQDHYLDLSNLSISFQERFKGMGNLPDLEESIRLGRASLALCPLREPDRHYFLSSLAFGVWNFHYVTGHRESADEYLTLLQEAARSCPSSHAESARYSFEICDFHARTDAHHYRPDIALQHLIRALSQSTCSAGYRLLKGEQALETLSNPFSDRPFEFLNDLVESYSLSLRLLPEILLLRQTIHEQLLGLSNAGRLSANAAYYSLLSGNAGLAVELLEAGRGVVWAEALRVRLPLDDVPLRFREELFMVCRRLENGFYRRRKTTVTPQHVAEDQVISHRKARKQFDDLINHIRAEPGLDNFLLADDFQRLSRCAERGPVVILTSSTSASHAIIIAAPGNVEGLQLDVTSTGLQQMVEALHDSNETLRAHRGHDCDASETQFIVQLKKLWYQVVLPVLKCLNFKRCIDRPDRPRLWWCLTAGFTWLPIHAAGVYDDTSGSESCADYVISSYVPTLGTLTRIRKNYTPVNRNDSQLLLAAVPEPCVGQRLRWDPLPGACDEVRAVIDVIPRSALFPLPVEDDALYGNGAGATIKTVVRGLQFASLLHLACHGEQHPTDALKSGFAMRDGLLTIERIIRHPSPQAFFAFLSACETAKGDRQQPDQVIHLAAAMLFSGFKSVIGTMWSMGDEDGALVASVVYRRLYERSGDFFDPNVIPLALDEAVHELRARHPHPARWAPYIHLGL